MTKRVRFDENAFIAEKMRKQDESDKPSTSMTTTNLPGSRFKENHSLDSDDEEEKEVKSKEDYEKLTEEDVEGAENEEISGDYTEDGGPVITPFNLKEEMAEGDFDTAGHYHFKKDKEIRDNWLDNIDWVKVKKVRQPQDEPMSDDETEKEAFDEIKVLEGIIQLLRKGETVSKGLRRLGGADKKKTKSRAWKRENVYDLEVDETADNSELKDTEGDGDGQKKDFLQLTELADQMAGAGHYDIYTDTFEKIQHKLNSVSDRAAVSIPEGTDDDDALDIFADDIDQSKLETITEKSETLQQEQTNGDEDDGTVKWKYKWSDQETELFGPFTSQQMAEWKEQGYFKDGVKAQRTDRPESNFYNISRIDFDLYD